MSKNDKPESGTNPPPLGENQRKALYSTVSNLLSAAQLVTRALLASERGFHPDIIRNVLLLDAKCDVRDASGDLRMVLEDLDTLENQRAK